MELKIIIPIVVALIGWVIAIWKTIIINKYKKSSVVFENRLKIYNEYFRKIDNINERLMIDFEKYLGPTINKVFESIMTDPENSNHSIINMQKELSNIQTKSMKTINQANEELQQLRFIASSKTLSILNEYKKLAYSQIKLIPDVLATINMFEFQNINIDENSKIKLIGQKLIDTRNELEKQMRKDLGIF